MGPGPKTKRPQIRTVSQRPQGGLTRPEKGSRLQTRRGAALEGPRHQALTGPRARPGGRPWRAQASWLLRLSGPQAQGALPAHLRASGCRDAPPPAIVQSWVRTSGLALCGERPPCFQGGSEVPSTPSWPCCGECSNRSPSRAITVPGLSMEPLDKCAQAVP